MFFQAIWGAIGNWWSQRADLNQSRAIEKECGNPQAIYYANQCQAKANCGILSAVWRSGSAIAFTNPVDGVDFLKSHAVDLLFLDIEMPMLSGFDVLEELGDSITFDVIFITAYDSFGIKAIKFSALDYLLKPVQNKELVAAVGKHLKKDARVAVQQMGQLLQNVKAERSGWPAKIGLISKDSIEYVEPDRIIMCEASSNYTIVYLDDGPQKVISKTLKEFEEMLTPFGFFRPHNS